MPETQHTEVDLETLSLDELRKLASEEAAAPEEAVVPVEKPRDELGRFVKPAADPVVVEKPVTSFRREIDLGDGAGKEVFEADSMESLLDKIVEAKAHASRKIREQQQKLREIEEAKEQTTADDEFILSQELMSKPTEAIKKLFKKTTGYDITEFKSVAERSKAYEAAQAQQAESQRQDEASVAFMKSHPDYLANEANGKRLVRELNSLIGAAKAEGRSVDYADVLEQAYTGLRNDGLLQIKSDDAQELPAKATPQAPVTPARRASSLAGRAPAVTQPRNAEPTEEELYSMDISKLRELADRQIRGQ
jgi:hypothetical protein